MVRIYIRYCTRALTLLLLPKVRNGRFLVKLFAKFFFCFTAFIIFCELVYMPIYYKLVNHGDDIEGWSIQTNRDTKIYVKPNQDTAIHEPKQVCPPHTRNIKNNLFLLIVVCSSTNNFNERVAIRKSWGNYRTYLELSKIYNETRRKYDINTYSQFSNMNKLNKELDEYVDYVYDNEGIIKVDDAVEIEYEPDFRLLFLLGLPSNDTNAEVQSKIEEEVEDYGDVLQEEFVDSYNNLTLKSIMLLKWVTKKCSTSVRYILKTDDDLYINVPALVTNLRNRSKYHDLIKPNNTEYLLIGNLICGAKPIADVNNKLRYCPRYMYSGWSYPCYVSGTGYAMSAPTAAALYRVALHLSYFHFEDIYITGMCAHQAAPPIPPEDDAMFSWSEAGPHVACAAHARVSVHYVAPDVLRRVVGRLLDPNQVALCERMRLEQVRRYKNHSAGTSYKATPVSEVILTTVYYPNFTKLSLL